MSTNFTTISFWRIKFIAFSLRDQLWRQDLGANGKIQKEPEQTET
jgi:hypothetical protein